jgi:hypothetical protein
VLAELYYLNVKHGRQLDFAATVMLLQASGQFVLLPFRPEDTLDFHAHQAVPEMHDRILVGAACRQNAVLITRDEQITKSGLVATIW